MKKSDIVPVPLATKRVTTTTTLGCSLNNNHRICLVFAKKIKNAIKYQHSRSKKSYVLVINVICTTLFHDFCHRKFVFMIKMLSRLASRVVVSPPVGHGWSLYLWLKMAECSIYQTRVFILKTLLSNDLV